jgi:hypothetical protein
MKEWEKKEERTLKSNGHTFGLGAKGTSVNLNRSNQSNLNRIKSTYPKDKGASPGQSC